MNEGERDGGTEDAVKGGGELSAGQERLVQGRDGAAHGLHGAASEMPRRCVLRQQKKGHGV